MRCFLMHTFVFYPGVKCKLQTDGKLMENAAECIKARSGPIETTIDPALLGYMSLYPFKAKTILPL
jgi:hypothetical protein